MIGLIKQGNVKVMRTREGTIFEIVGGLMVLAMWAVAVWAYFYSGTGEAGAIASEAGVETVDVVIEIVICAIGTFSTIFALIGAYHPDTMVNIPVTVSSAEGWLWVTRMARVLALELPLLFMTTTLDEVLMPGPILTVATSVVLMITLVVFCIIIARKK